MTDSITTSTPLDVIDGSRRSDAMTAARIAEGLDPDIQRGLAALHGAPAPVIELTLATHRFGTRSLYQGLGFVVREHEDGQERLKLTQLGHDVIAACAGMHQQLDDDVESAVRKLRARLNHPEQARRLKMRGS
jgi:hypothetical protein